MKPAQLPRKRAKENKSLSTKKGSHGLEGIQKDCNTTGKMSEKKDPYKHVYMKPNPHCITVVESHALYRVFHVR